MAFLKRTLQSFSWTTCASDDDHYQLSAELLPAVRRYSDGIHMGSSAIALSSFTAAHVSKYGTWVLYEQC
jgi:hypothetical protein